MAFRTVLINEASRINLDLNNIVIYYRENSFWINLDEISTIIFDDSRCSITLRILTELCEKGINVVLCNQSHMPVGSINTLYHHSRAAKNIYQQINWDQTAKQVLWVEIIKQKIAMQIEVLKKYHKYDKIEYLNVYRNQVIINDANNREALASRIYFKELFGNNFKRFNEDIINFALNYAYQIIRSKISQEIVSAGYVPAIGIFHRSEYNQYNLADDFIEVYRPIIDYYVYELLFQEENEYLSSSLKEKIVDLLNQNIIFNGVEQKLHRSITLYIQMIFSFLETGEIEKIKFPLLK